MTSIGRSVLSRHARVRLPSGLQKKLPALSCQALRMEIQNSARRNIRTRLVWQQYALEVSRRIQRQEDASKDSQADTFTPTDMSLIFASFASARKRIPEFIDQMLEKTRSRISKYDIRDIAVLYNGLLKLGVQGDEMLNSFSKTVETKITSKTSEKDLALLLNAIIELKLTSVDGIFLKASLLLSSRIKYISNCHTLTLLLNSYSRYRLLDDVKRDVPADDVGHPAEQTDGGVRPSGQNNERPPQVLLIQEVTLSLLGRCAEMMIRMRATDIMYYYRAGYNLIYRNSEGVTQQLYASMLNLPKAHLRIVQHLLEFESRELITLLETFVGFEKEAEAHQQLDDGGSLWELNNEIRKSVPALRDTATNELLYRSRMMSFSDCLCFLKLMEVNDHRGLLVYRRLTYKLNKLNSWEKYQKSQLWELLHCLDRRTVSVTSKEAQDLVVAIVRNISVTLKLKEIEVLLRISATLGGKTNALVRKAMSVHCRADLLQPSQAASILYHLTGLGYINNLEPIMKACLKVDNVGDAAKVLAALGILKVNGLMSPPKDLLEVLRPYMNEGMIYGSKGDIINRLALARAAGLYEDDIFPVDIKYRLHHRTFGKLEHVSLKDVQVLGAKKLKVDYRVLTLEERTGAIAQSLEEFIAMFDESSILHVDYELTDIVVPIVVELSDSRRIAVHVLLDDFYSGKNQMLRIDVYAQLKLLRQRGLNVVCCLAQEFTFDDSTQFIARLLQRCKAADEGCEEQDKKVHPSVGLDVTKPLVNSFSRLQALVSY